jgi:hypothetical protein
VFILVFCNQAFTSLANYFTIASPTNKSFFVSLQIFTRELFLFEERITTNYVRNVDSRKVNDVNAALDFVLIIFD